MAIDPGGSIGVAIRRADGTITTLTTKNPQEVYDYFTHTGFDHVACEWFSTSGRISAFGLHTVRIVGGIEALCYVLGIPYTSQMPQQRYAFMDEALKILKETNTAFTQHQHDALAHLLRLEYDLAGEGYR